MKELTGKIRTRIEVKAAIKDAAEEKDSFKTGDIADELRERGGNVVMSNHRIAQYLKAQGTHEYHKGLKKWIKIRN